MFRSLVCLPLLLIGCGNAAQSPDLGMVAPDLAMPGCVLNLTRSYFSSSIIFLPSDQGFDLNGDGVIDNALGTVGPAANPGFATSIMQGSEIVLVSISNLQGPPLVENDLPEVAIFVAVDADLPPDPTNNANDGAFLVPVEELDVDCKPTTLYDSSVVQGGAILSRAKHTALALGTTGTLDFVDTVMKITPRDANLDNWDGLIGGVELACSLSLTPFPGPNPASLLDVVVNAGLTPDIDRDHDGLEQIIGDGTTIKECIDGDGTVIPGRNCPCDPRIADGFSGGLAFTLVPARIVGLTTAQ